MQDGIRAVQLALGGASRWPMYVRQAKQFLKNSIEGFDERKYGFASVVDLLRAAGKEGVLRIERDRQGAIRVFPGEQLAAQHSPVVVEEQESDVLVDVPLIVDGLSVEAVEEAPIVEAVVEEVVADFDLGADEDEDVDEVNGNVAGLNTHEMMTVTAAIKRKPSPRAKGGRRAAPHGKSAAGAAAGAPPRRGARKTTRRQKADAK
jgi:hypothetical protein